MTNRRDKPNPFDLDMTPLHDFMKQMDSFFHHSFKQMNEYFHFKPFWVDVNETDSHYVIKADLPGYNRDQVQLEILGNRVFIRAEDKRMLTKKELDQNYFHKRQSHTKKEQVITLPFAVPKHEVKATFDDSTLTMTIPKRDNIRIPIKIEDA